MKNFINYLKGLAVLFYFALPLLFYAGAVAGFYHSVVNVNATSFYWLLYALITLAIAIVLTFTIGYKHFADAFRPNKDRKASAADKGAKVF